MITKKLIVRTHTLFLYHVNSYESRNFSKSEAKVSMGLSKMFTFMTFKIWEVDVPEKARGFEIVKKRRVLFRIIALLPYL